jgi:hypothetical protein
VAKFFAILLGLKGVPPTPFETIERVLDKQTVDWLRLAGGQYIVKGFGDHPEPIYDALKPILGASDNILVIEVNLANRYGWMAQIGIDWINKHSP